MAFLLPTLESLAVQLNGRVYPVTWEHRPETIGATIPGTARVAEKELLVEADVSVPWLHGDKLDKAVEVGIGADFICHAISTTKVGNITAVVEAAVASISLLRRVVDKRRVHVRLP